MLLVRYDSEMNSEPGERTKEKSTYGFTLLRQLFSTRVICTFAISVY